MKKLYRHLIAWRSTIVVFFIMLFIAAGVWFEKLTDTALVALLPLAFAMFKEWQKEHKKKCEHEQEQDAK